MSLDVSPDDYNRIRSLITSPDSPVGIDAERTHVIIINLLEEIRGRLDALEARAGNGAQVGRSALEPGPGGSS